MKVKCWRCLMTFRVENPLPLTSEVEQCGECGVPMTATRAKNDDSEYVYCSVRSEDAGKWLRPVQ